MPPGAASSSLLRPGDGSPGPQLQRRSHARQATPCMLEPLPSGLSFAGNLDVRLQQVEAVPPAGALSADAADAPAAVDAAGEPGSAAGERGRRHSRLRWLFSAAAAPWRSRSVSASAEAAGPRDGQDAAGRSLSVSMHSQASMAPWATSLAELSSE